MKRARSRRPASSTRFAGEAKGECRTVDGNRQVAQQEGEATGVVLVAVGEHHRFDGVGMVAQIRQIREHQVDARHVGLGEHDAAVENHDATAELDTHSSGRSLRDRPER